VSNSCEGQRVIRALIIFGCCCLVALLVTVGLDRYGLSCRHFGKVGEVSQPATRKLMVATPTAAYQVWKQNGYHGRKLLLLSGEWQQINPAEILPQLGYSPYPLRLFSVLGTMERESLSDASFLFLASYRGILRQIRAVLPDEAYAEREQRAMAAKTRTFGNGEVMITYQGQPRYFTTIHRPLPGGEPFLILVTADFLSTHSAEEVARYLAGVRTDCLILCSDRDNPAVGERERRRLATLARLLGMPASATPERMS